MTRIGVAAHSPPLRERALGLEIELKRAHALNDTSET